jgi:aspartate racemase
MEGQQRVPAECIGLIGGLSVGSACHCYKALAQAYPRHCGKFELSLVHADLTMVLDYVAKNEPQELANYLAGQIERLRGSGATLAAIPAVTPHFCVTQLKARATLPIVDLLEAVVSEVQLRKLKRVTVFGTRYVIEKNLFGVLDDIVEVVSPASEEINRVHELYLRLIQQGSGRPADIAELNGLARSVSDRGHAEAVLLAGTDFSVIPSDLLEFPHMDCTEIHLRAILRRICG